MAPSTYQPIQGIADVDYKCLWNRVCVCVTASEKKYADHCSVAQLITQQPVVTLLRPYPTNEYTQSQSPEKCDIFKWQRERERESRSTHKKTVDQRNVLITSDCRDTRLHIES